MFQAPGYHAIRQFKKNEKAGFGEGDVLVLFGELFTRGYANGLVEAAQRRGMRVIRATVGRREKEGTLRALTAEELAASPQPLINIPLEAGFDLEPASDGLSPVDRIKDTKLSEWESCQLDFQKIYESRDKGRERFTRAVRAYVQELKKQLPSGKNILFAHLMAGGVPRAKIIMPLMNRSVKGTGDRYLSSEKFWKTDLGKLCELSFHEVTAETFRVLVEETKEIRENLEKSGGFAAYTAYGYHGTEILVNGEYDWQSYSPYLQGWAKIDLENQSRAFSKQGVRTCVYNCPEILTNSSSIFQGVEIPLYPLLLSLNKQNPTSNKTKKLEESCRALLKPEHTIQDVLKVCHDTLSNPELRKKFNFSSWPEHNEEKQLSIVLAASEKVFEMHKDSKNLMTSVLSEVVITSCGAVMVEDSAAPASPVTWLNHDVVAHTHFEA
ncbi:MAG: enoyl-acyl carrier protein reductase FabMG [Bdellovibrio sp.]|jgi:hypothetical protein